jgi:hypothetical protein
MGHEQLVVCHDKASGYRGIVAIHDTTLGPALGGTRFWHYATDEEAVIDALRLARGMTYKNAVAGLNLGGGKSVIIGDNRTPNREMIFRAHGRFVDSLGRALRDGRGRGHEHGRHGLRPHGDRLRRGPRGRLGRPVAGHGARRLPRHPGERPAPLGVGLARGEDRSRSRGAATSAATSPRSCTPPAPGSSSPTSTPSA